MCAKLRGGGLSCWYREPAVLSEMKSGKMRLVFQAENSGGDELRKVKKTKIKARETC